MFSIKSFVIIFSILHFVASISPSVFCNDTIYSRRFREALKNKIYQNNSVYLVTNLAILDSESATKDYEKKLIELQEIEIGPMKIVQDHSNLTSIVIHLEESSKFYEYFNENLKKSKIENFKVNLRIKEHCLDSFSNVKKFQLLSTSNNTGCSLLMLACHVKKTDIEGKYKIKKEILIVTKNEEELTKNEILKCFKRNFKFKNLIYKEFDVDGLCICDHLEFFLNDCKQNFDGNFWTFIGVIVIIFLILFFLIIIEIHSRLIQTDEE
ncbi:hypothetical protein PVAND_001478 [Polypedilum vanderplanki]|uniref:Uncharacterized protein n=1 Tax=Polypedilum vanderplanki TaxID=319348 RepID=A0A9J6BNI9_POLVA|nr:hypothetical protein PVAND_001478 [Polypedilum vanderplanki]